MNNYSICMLMLAVKLLLSLFINFCCNEEVQTLTIPSHKPQNFSKKRALLWTHWKYHIYNSMKTQRKCLHLFIIICLNKFTCLLNLKHCVQLLVCWCCSQKFRFSTFLLWFTVSQLPQRLVYYYDDSLCLWDLNMLWIKYFIPMILLL